MLSAPEAFHGLRQRHRRGGAKSPPYVTYRVHGTVHFFKGDGAVDRTVTVRTADGDAVVHDDSARSHPIRGSGPKDSGSPTAIRLS